MSTELDGQAAWLRPQLADLFIVRPAVYWADYVACTVLGWCAFVGSLASQSTPVSALALVVAVFALYRSVAFNHELIHNPHHAPTGLLVAWHAFTGIPLAVPIFLYRRLHLAHHSPRGYATSVDPEYAGFARAPAQAVVFVLSSLVLPMLSLVRFLILAPLTLLHPKLRELVRTRASSMGIKIMFTRAIPTRPEELRAWAIQEAATSAWAWATAICWYTGLLPSRYFLHWYVVIAGIAILNAIRALAMTHSYTYAPQGETSLATQVLDSHSLDGHSLIGALLCPVGLRYHALHHMFPSLPYHGLGLAHRRAVKLLPPESPYHRVRMASLREGLVRVFARSGRAH